MECIKIAKGYFDSVKRKPIGKDRKVFLRMQATFPQLRHWWGEGIRSAGHEFMGNLVRQAREQNDYRSVPMRAFTEEPWSPNFKQLLVRFSEVFANNSEKMIRKNCFIVQLECTTTFQYHPACLRCRFIATSLNKCDLK